LDGRVGRRSPSEGLRTSGSYKLEARTAEALNPVKHRDSKVTPTTNNTGYLFDVAKETTREQRINWPFAAPGLFLGTSAFAADGWQGTFYAAGVRPADYLKYYSSRFRTVEVDSTFYGTPSAATVKRWYEKTPQDFIFAAKVPQ
jgi:hypothetical protein